MGAPNQKWTSKEEDMLRAGVNKHDIGKWRIIQMDPEFSKCLAYRYNNYLKDKWRNLSATATGLGSREKSRLPKLKGCHAMPVSSYSGTTGYPLVNDESAKSPIVVDSRYIIEAITVLHEPNGSEIGAICSFLEQRHEVQNSYMLKNSSTFAIQTPTPKQKDPAVRPHQNSGLCNDIVDVVPTEEASEVAVYKVVEAEEVFRLMDKSGLVAIRLMYNAIFYRIFRSKNMDETIDLPVELREKGEKPNPICTKKREEVAIAKVIYDEDVLQEEYITV